MAEDHIEGLPEQMQVRLAKRERMLASGTEPYPAGFPRTATASQIRERFPDLPPDSATGEQVGVAGRVMLSRIGGKLCFATLRDGSGDIQVMISADRVGEDALAAWKRDVDLGDHVGVEGEVISSRRGELSVLADRFAITAKRLRPLPDKHKGLSDVESRVRQRYVDLIVNPGARRMAEIKSAVTRTLREELNARGFLEVESAACRITLAIVETPLCPNGFFGAGFHLFLARLAPQARAGQGTRTNLGHGQSNASSHDGAGRRPRRALKPSMPSARKAQRWAAHWASIRP